jgi:hypothetical protein
MFLNQHSFGTGGPPDNFRGTVEQGCPLCNWFGHTHAFQRHWNSHSLPSRLIWSLRRNFRRLKSQRKNEYSH